MRSWHSQLCMSHLTSCIGKGTLFSRVRTPLQPVQNLLYLNTTLLITYFSICLDVRLYFTREGLQYKNTKIFKNFDVNILRGFIFSALIGTNLELCKPFLHLLIPMHNQKKFHQEKVVVDESKEKKVEVRPPYQAEKHSPIKWMKQCIKINF